MPAYAILHCDVFAPRTGTGNPLAVDAEGEVWVGGDCRTVLRGELQWP